MFRFLFSFNGRVSRIDLWKFVIALWCLNFALFFVSIWSAAGASLTIPQFLLLVGWHSLFETFQSSDNFQRLMIVLSLVICLVVIVAQFAVVTKRLHDRNKSARWLIPFMLIPIGCQIAAIHILAQSVAASLPVLILGGVLAMWGTVELLFLPGTLGTNRFGPDPLGGPVINPFSGGNPG